ncbi:Zinc finger RING-CH-type [Penicillium cf. griseofulvum]|uniref:Zinc finger RING-CH-type n=1 Tax=Penicillium cf. griseofulvum TaxID=2972120 RepID=A0A9W9J3J2_9EURO|nr:Zinc finger RING-CH-type [Penicillium cf. griseofulvum]KAJ5434267.1 Zinc finger RING-CH-type [Penicillium cf. griseofulvum]KAJ5452097.1 Zinc finger RING-CH-type [Penicillium cf. griseofulvum]
MASVPGYSAAGRTTPFDGTTSTNSDENTISQESISPQNESMEDTETVFLNKSVSTPSHGSDISNKSLSQSPKPSHASDEDEPRKCWICYTDETEDSPLNLEWRSPCPCALTAHEACLLDWLADMENPRSRKSSGGVTMMCPQCKTEIVVTRPRSYVVDMMRLAERVAGRLVLPGMMFTVAGTVWAGCCAHGVYSMYLIFGTDEARQIMEETMEGPWNPGMNIGLPLIPLVLIFSRTRYAEGLLPAIPVLFFAAHNPGQEPDFDLWPPTPAMTFAALPYIKSFYGALYERLFGGLERKWIAEVQPRAAEEILDDAQQQDQAEGLNRFGDNANGQILMEIDLELQMGMGDADEPDLEALPIGQDEAANGGPNGAQDAAQNNNPLGLGRRQNEIIADTSNLADVVLGALVFPAISASMGGLLKYLLPKSWTSPAMDRGRLGLLQTRWGRSVVGGCMFVLLKDALVLYCRWKLAQTHRRRKVLNYDRAKKHHATKRSTG